MHCVSLGWNHIRGSGAELLAKALIKNSSLSSLSLNGNAIGDEGAEGFAGALTENRTLTVLGYALLCFTLLLAFQPSLFLCRLADNKIRESGAGYLAKSLRVNQSLIEFDLAANKIGSAALEEFVNVMRLNETLAVLQVTPKTVSDSSLVEELQALLGRNAYIRRQAFFDAFAKDKKHPWYRARILLIGNGGCGKTATLRSLVNEDFEPVWVSTIGANVVESRTTGSSNHWEKIARSTARSSVEIQDSLLGKHSHACVQAANSVFSDLRKRLHTESEANDTESSLSSDSSEVLVCDTKELDPVMHSEEETPMASPVEQDLTPAQKPRFGFGRKLYKVGSNLRFSKLKKLNSFFQRKKSLENVMNVEEYSHGIPMAREVDLGMPNPSTHGVRNVHAAIPVGNEVPTREVSRSQLVFEAAAMTPSNRIDEGGRLLLLEDTAQDSNIVRYDRELMLKASRDHEAITFSVCDFGGQNVFHMLHQVFLTRDSIYVLVFDMRTLLFHSDEVDGSFDRTPETRRTDSFKSVKFWMSSVAIHAGKNARVVLVGTFCNEMRGGADLKVVNDTLSAMLHDYHHLSAQVVRNDASHLLFFPIDNATSKGIDTLRFTLEKCARQLQSFHARIPLRWLKFLDHLQVAARNPSEFGPYKGKVSPVMKLTHLSLATVKGIADSYNISCENEVCKMLRTFHQLGLCFYSAASETLKDVVVLDPQWLISRISQIIRDQDLHAVDVDKLRSVELFTDYQFTRKTGIISRDLVNFLWDNDPETEFLLELMNHSMLLSSWVEIEPTEAGTMIATKNKQYLVPSLLHGDYSYESFSNSATMSRCIIDFSETFLPEGVFERVLCLLLDAGFRSKAETVSKGFVELWRASSLSRTDGEWSRMILVNESASGVGNDCLSMFVEEQDTTLAKEALDLLPHMLNKINTEVMRSQLSWRFWFQGRDEHRHVVSTTQPVSYESARRQKLVPWFSTSQLGAADTPQTLFANSLSLENFLHV